MIKKDFDNRIKSVADLVDKNIIIEIGADHGYISKCVMDNKNVKFAYLTDISSKCIEKAKNTFKQKQYHDKLSFLVGDGLEALKGICINKKSCTVVVAGMGGMEIKKILAKNSGYENFVLQPQKNAYELRQFLNEQNYKIVVDKKVRDKNFFYDIIKVKKDTKKQKLSHLELLFGRTNLKEKNIYFEEFLTYKANQIDEMLKNNNIAKLQNEKNDIEKAIKILEKRRIL